jgi:gluconolactonase
MRKLFVLTTTAILMSCGNQKTDESTGSIERLDPQLDQIIPPEATIDVLAQGYDWSEGPVWVQEHKMLLFSDVPANTIYKWTEEGGAEVYLKPSGYTGTIPRGGEPGSNGLTLNPQGNLVLCQHGDRRVAVMVATLDHPEPVFTTLADNFEGKKLNSPNDVIYDRKGNMYFTDPPYGLAADSLKELPFQGVFRVNPDGAIELLVDSLTRPNGIAFSPDESKLYISNSDPEKARWYEYEFAGDSIVSGKVFYDATNLTATSKGLPDGMKVNQHGVLFCSGPGGIFIFSPTAKLLGNINLPDATANCAFDADEQNLFLTSDMKLLRIKLHK